MKFIRNKPSLIKFFTDLSVDEIENIKEHSIFDKRAEELDVDDYIFLTNLLSNGNI